MTTDTLDDQGRAAAERLHTAVRSADTEAALTRTLGDPRSVNSRLVRARRPLAVAAAVVLVAGALGVGTWAIRGDDDAGRPVKTAASPAEPASYGPLLGTLRGGTNPTLRAEIYGPRELRDGSEIAIAVSGGQPGWRYRAEQCTANGPGFNPAGNCGFVDGDVTLDRNGEGVVVVTIWRVFTSYFGNVIDCMGGGCQLQFGAGGTDSPPDQFFGVLPTALEVPEGTAIPLTFDADEVVPVPAFAAGLVDRTPDQVTVRLTGRDLQPGAMNVGVDGTTQDRTGFLIHAPGEASRSVTTVTVDADGMLDVEVKLPLVIEDADHSTSIDDVPQPPAVVRCNDAGSSCRILLATTGELTGRSSHLRPGPEPYPTD